MRIIDRLLLLIFSLFVGFSCLIILFMTVGFIHYNDASDYLLHLYHTEWLRNTYLLISILFILISVRLIYLSLRRSQAHAPSIDQTTEFGDIRISLETVENLVLKSAAKIRGVKDLKARVKVGDTGLEIIIRSVVDGESSIPQLTEAVQRSVKGHLEEITGIPVVQVSVYVANIIQSSNFKSRVE